MKATIERNLISVVDRMADIGQSIDYRLRNLRTGSMQMLVRLVEWSADLGERQNNALEKGANRFFKSFHLK